LQYPLLTFAILILQTQPNNNTCLTSPGESLYLYQNLPYNLPLHRIHIKLLSLNDFHISSVIFRYTDLAASLLLPV